MNYVPARYRNVINPWQTPSEIRNAIGYIDRMLTKLKLSKEDELRLLCDHLDIDWRPPV